MKQLFTNIYNENDFFKLNTFDIVKDRYLINCYGVIFDTKTGRYKNINTLDTGYCVTTLLTERGSRPMLIHRLVASIFCYQSDPSKNVVNHKDYNRSNNYYLNLEWVTTKENINHSIDNIRKSNLGENSPNSRLNESQVHTICRLLEQNVQYKYILEEIGLEYNDKNRNMITKIRNKDTWVHISNNYNITQNKLVTKPIIRSEEEIRMICSFIQQGYSNKEIMFVMNMDISTRLNYEKSLSVINNIRKRKTHLKISKDYDW